jgi:hypothetical protein
MENRPAAADLRIGVFASLLGAPPRPISLWVAAFLLGALAIGCAAPGEPYERKPPTPAAVTDLTAVQEGNSVVLTFTLPQQTLDKRPLQQLPSVDIYRSFAQAPEPGRNFVVTLGTDLLVTVPAAMVESYVEQGRFRYSDALTARDFAQHPDSVATYAVGTDISEKKRSALSNAPTLRIYPAAVPIADLKTLVTHAAIVLSWTPPDETLAGRAPSVEVYHIYRGVPDPSAGPGAGGKLKSPLTKIADAPAPPFLDTQFDFGAHYVYSVRSVAQYPDAAIESSDSNLAEVAPRDTFPPVAPQELVVVLLPRQGGTPAHLELSWAINPETDIAGYNVYRSEQEGTPGVRLTGDAAQKLLLTPAFSDMNVQPGHRYFYSVTAVDRAGNESPASAAVSGDVPAESQTTP